MKESCSGFERDLNCNTSKLAIISLIFAFLAIVGTLVLSEDCGLYRMIKSCVLLAMSTFSMLLGILAIFKIRKSKASLRGKGLAITAMILSFYVSFFVFMGPRIRSISYRMICGSNLSNLGKAILIYASDNDGKFPSASNWCDLLIEHEHADVTKAQFICGDSFLPVFSYGFNKNLDGLRIGDVSPETVVLFEIEGGRNVSGGPELLMEDDRHHGEGCNILFNDYHVEFVQTGREKDIKWEIEKKDLGIDNSELNNLEQALVSDPNSVL